MPRKLSRSLRTLGAGFLCTVSRAIVPTPCWRMERRGEGEGRTRELSDDFAVVFSIPIERVRTVAPQLPRRTLATRSYLPGRPSPSFPSNSTPGFALFYSPISSTEPSPFYAARSIATSSTSQAPVPSNLTSESQFTSPRPSIPAEAHSVRRRGIFPPAVTPEVDSVVLDKDGQVIAQEITPEEDSSYIPLPLSNQSLSILYAFTTPPPVSALSALAHRLASTLDSTTSSHLSYSLVDNLPLLEQCLIHESFWIGVSELAPPPKGSERIYTNFNDAPISNGTATPLQLHNGPLATLGNALLGALTSELLLSSFPHLPSRVTKAALTMYAGPKSLAAVASSWGVGPSRLERRLVGTPDLVKQSKGDRAYGHLVGGVGPGKIEKSEFDGAAGMGLARWNRRVSLRRCHNVLELMRFFGSRHHRRRIRYCLRTRWLRSRGRSSVLSTSFTSVVLRLVRLQN